jgi:hypothetical protein
MTAVSDLSGLQLALYDEARQSADPASYLRTAFDWSVADRRAVAEALDVSCPGCIGRGTGTGCCMCGLPVPEGLRRQAGDPSDLPGAVVAGWPFPIAAGVSR